MLFHKNEKGQLLIESMLLIIILMGAFLVLTKQIKERKMMQDLVTKPMERLGRMAGYGTWQEKCTGQGKSNKLSPGQCHPNSIQRSLSSNPNP